MPTKGGKKITLFFRQTNLNDKAKEYKQKTGLLKDRFSVKQKRLSQTGRPYLSGRLAGRALPV